MKRDAIAPFDQLYETSSDPWGTTTRWYEQRKRALLLASLPRACYGAAYEAGCGTGHISRMLAERCVSLVASDASAKALAVAAPVLADCGNVSVALHRLPRDWPERHFDLIVLSEILYFLDADERVAVAVSASNSAGGSGTVVACDWRGPIEGRGHSGDEVHRRFADELALPKVFEYVDDDFLLTGWSADVRTAAMRDGLR